MSGDHTNRPVHGTAAGDAYVALPPTAVDAAASGPTRLIVAWPGFDPPRTASALAAAIPMTGVPVWRVYLDLPGRSPGGLGSGAILETESIEAYCASVEMAVERLPDAIAEIRGDLAIPDGPVALAGFSAGGAAALLAVARGAVPVSTVALVAPVVAPSRAARAVEKRSGRDRAWTEHAVALADRLDLGAHAADIAGRGVPALLLGGAKDRVVPAREITALRDELRRHGGEAVESATFRMGHALAAEPGTEPRPPITEAVRVDGILTDWFRDHLAHPAATGAWSTHATSDAETASAHAPGDDGATAQDQRTDAVSANAWHGDAESTQRAAEVWDTGGAAEDEVASRDTQPMDRRNGAWAQGDAERRTGAGVGHQS
jgi:predicted esterase